MVAALLCITAAPAAFAGKSDDAAAVVRRIPVQDRGRVKPFDSLARETIRRITGSPAVDGEDPVRTLLAIMAEPEAWQARPLIEIPFRPLREALGMDPAAPRISYNDLVATRKLMRMLPAIVQKQEQDEKLTMLEQETMDAFERFVAFSRLTEHELHLVPAASADPVWLPVLKADGYPEERQAALRNAWTGLLQQLRAGNAPAARGAAVALASELAAAHPAAYPPSWRMQLELFYNHARPFHAARLIYLLAALLLLIQLVRGGRLPGQLGQAALWFAALLHLAGILLRVVLGGRPPVSNFYETTLWLPFVAVILGLILGRVYRSPLFGFAASLLAGSTLVLADYLPLDSSISPVVAVLRSNLWLTIHVLTIVASYGALALATMLAHVYGVMVLVGSKPKPLATLDLFLYRAIQVGVVLLAGGIMLGAVWANASWGRYWGWDPKETWALITLIWFIAILHGRFAGWLHGAWVALGTIGGFLLLLMTYYGVSFYLVGLHSYAGGNAKPLPALLVGYLIAEAVFVTAVALAARRKPFARPGV
jgi:cytochrome c-type biogenesis protein CcsB